MPEHSHYLSRKRRIVVAFIAAVLLLSAPLLLTAYPPTAHAQSPAARAELQSAADDLSKALEQLTVEIRRTPPDTRAVQEALAAVEATSAHVAERRNRLRETLGARAELWRFAVRELARVESWVGDPRYNSANVARLLATIRRDIKRIDGPKANEDFNAMAEIIEFGARYVNSPIAVGKDALADYVKNKPQIGQAAAPVLDMFEFAEGQLTDVQGALLGAWSERLSKANQALKFAKLMQGIGSREDALQPGELDSLVNLLDLLGDLIPATKGGSLDFIKGQPGSALKWTGSGIDMPGIVTGLLPIKLYVSWLKITVENMDLSAAVGHASRGNLQTLIARVEKEGRSEIRSNNERDWGIQTLDGLFREIGPLPVFFEAGDGLDFDYGAGNGLTEVAGELDAWDSKVSPYKIAFKASNTYPMALAYLVPAETGDDEGATESASSALESPKFDLSGRYEGRLEVPLPKVPGRYELRLYDTNCKYVHYNCAKPIARVILKVRHPDCDKIPWAGVWQTPLGNLIEVTMDPQSAEVRGTFKEVRSPETVKLGIAAGATMFDGKVVADVCKLTLYTRWPADLPPACVAGESPKSEITTVVYNRDKEGDYLLLSWIGEKAAATPDGSACQTSTERAVLKIRRVP